MKKIFLFIASSAFISTTIIAQNKGTVNLSKGQKYNVESKVTTTSSSEMQGQSMETNVDATTLFNIEVTDVADNYNMNNKIAAIKLNMNSMGQTMNFDSDKKEDMDGDMGNNVKSIINQPQSVVMDKSGNVIVDKKTDTAKSSDNPTAIILKQMGDPIQQGYGAKFAFMPVSKKLKAGDAWMDSTSDEGLKRVTNYSVKDITNNVATIEVNGTEDRDIKVEMQQMQVETKTTGKFTGEKTVNVTNGVILKDTTTMDATGTISVMGQDIPTTIKATTVNTVTPL